MRFDIEFDTSGFAAKVAAFEREFDEEQVIDEAADVILQRILNRFSAETDPDGNRWIPSAAAIREKRKTLFRTGKLFRSIQVVGAMADGVDSTARGIDSRGVSYARKHDEGIGQELRRFLGLDRAGEDRIATLEYLQNRVDRIVERIDL